METIPFDITAVYAALVMATAIALVVILRKSFAASSAKNKWVPVLLLIVVQTAFIVLALEGVFLNTLKNTPPVFFPAVATMILLTVYFALFYKPLQHPATKLVGAIIALQVFRLGLELVFAWALSAGLMPVQMTFEGRNFDVLTGLTAPFIAYFGYYRKVLPNWVLIAWNFAGLALLANIVTIAILSAPTQFQLFTNEPHNTIVTIFPFQFIPFFFVPLALFGHLFALKVALGKR